MQHKLRKAQCQTNSLQNKSSSKVFLKRRRGLSTLSTTNDVTRQGKL